MVLPLSLEKIGAGLTKMEKFIKVKIIVDG